MQGQVLVISGPSGSGKSSLISLLLKNFSNSFFSVSATSRNKRENEKDGIDYHFISKEKFESEIKKNNFLEYAKVHDNYYGTPYLPIQKALQEQKLVILDIDVQGFFQVKEKLNTTSIFITTKNKLTLKNRLKNRLSENAKSIEKRLQTASEEIKEIKNYDFLLINDDLYKTYANLENITKCMFFNVKNIKLQSILSKWNEF